MNFIRKSLTLKYLLFLIASLLPFFVALFIYKDLNPTLKVVLFASLIGVFILSFTAFVIFILRPLNRITPQVKSLFRGRKYKRVPPLSPDSIGVLTHFFNETTRNLEKISVDLLEQKRIFSELDIARKLQQDVLPKDSKNIERLDIVAKTKSAAEMGGDSFDFIQRDQNTLLYIGDVTGHGLPAGLIMMMANALIHAYSSTDYSPSKILAMVNKTLCKRISSQRFMTLVMLRWDAFKKKMFYTGAGHERILVYRSATRTVDAIKSGGIALRMADDIEGIVKESELEFNVNDVILLYTDGITEARNSNGEMYGLERLKKSLQNHGYRHSTESIFDRISDDFSDFVGSSYMQDDDITMIVIKHLPEDAANREAVKLIVKPHDDSVISVNKKWEW